jgi:hypothetical protein
MCLAAAASAASSETLCMMLLLSNAAECLAAPKGLHAIPVPIDEHGIIPDRLQQVSLDQSMPPACDAPCVMLVLALLSQAVYFRLSTVGICPGVCPACFLILPPRVALVPHLLGCRCWRRLRRAPPLAAAGLSLSCCIQCPQGRTPLVS